MIQPRRLIHHGTVEAEGFLFDLRLIAEQEMRRRVLELWVPGATLHRAPGSALLRIPVPLCIASRQAPGLPLVAREGVLLAAPLDADELRALAPPYGSLVLMRGGTMVVEHPTAWTLEDPASWLDLDEYMMLESVSLGDPPAVAVDAAPPMTFEGRTRLKGVPEADPKRATVLEALRAHAHGKSYRTTDGKEGLGEWLKRGFPSLLSGLLERRPRESASTGTATGTPKPRSHGNIRSTLLKALWKSRLGQLMGVPHARYLQRTMSMFDRGDILEALRHALPLGGPESPDAPPPGFTTPSRRSNLILNPAGGGRVRSTLSLAPDLMRELKERYRQAVAHLERQGKITEAAFVLADLLYETAEAVAFLEGHGERRLAAELAEGRQLAPEIVIRQWILAGDGDRAVMIARRTGAYAIAIQSLERHHPEKAEILRLLMADALATSGDYAAAADVIWPITDSRHIALAWIDRAIGGGGPVGARMLARRLAMPESPDGSYYQQALALLANGDIETAETRHAFALGLLAETPNDVTRTLARAAVRSLAGDVSAGGVHHHPAHIRSLVSLAGDGALRADLPPLPPADASNTLAQRTPRLEITIAAADTGIGPVHDAALLPNGRLALALGEAGVHLLTRDGRVVAHFPQPAERLVISDSGDRAIALAPRGEVWRIARIDFMNRRAESWCQAKIDTWTENFDGSAWLVGIGREVLMIDAIASEFRTLWRWKDVGIGVETIVRAGHDGAFLAATLPTDAWGRALRPGDETVVPSYELWLVNLQSQTLRSRTEQKPQTPPGGDISSRAISPLGSIADCVTGAGSIPLAIRIDGVACDLSLDAEEHVPIGLIHSEAWTVATFRTSGGVHSFLISRPERIVRASIRLLGASHARARLSPNHLLLADDRGRILVLDLNTGRILRDIRLR